MNFFCLAVFYLLLDAQFVFVVQIAVYAGAIMVLFLFVLMLLGRPAGVAHRDDRGQRVLAVVLPALLLVGVITAVVTGIPNDAAGLAAANRGDVSAIGRLFTEYTLARPPGCSCSWRAWRPGAGRPERDAPPRGDAMIRRGPVDVGAPKDGTAVTAADPAVAERLAPAGPGGGDGEKGGSHEDRTRRVPAAVGGAVHDRRRHGDDPARAIVVFMCVELMLNAVNLTLIAFSRPAARSTARSCRSSSCRWRRARWWSASASSWPSSVAGRPPASTT